MSNQHTALMWYCSVISILRGRAVNNFIPNPDPADMPCVNPDELASEEHTFGGNVSELLKYFWLGRYITIHAVD